MRAEGPFPPPFGVPAGPFLATPQLVSAYLAGARTGSSPEAHIEEPVLMAYDHLLAVRLDVAVLVRGEVPPVAASVKAVLCRTLEAASMVLVEKESVLGGAVAVELAVPRGFEWDLWARDPADAEEALTRRALGEWVGSPEAETARNRTEAEMEAVLEQIEREW